jgi:hypothetical protein
MTVSRTLLDRMTNHERFKLPQTLAKKSGSELRRPFDSPFLLKPVVCAFSASEPSPL